MLSCLRITNTMLAVHGLGEVVSSSAIAGASMLQRDYTSRTIVRKDGYREESFKNVKDVVIGTD